MTLAYLRTKLCSLKMNSERLFIPSSRSRRINLFHRLSLGMADEVSGRAVASSASVVFDRDKLLWQTPAVVKVDDLTTTSIVFPRRDNSTTAVAVIGITRSTSKRVGHVTLRIFAYARLGRKVRHVPRNNPILTIRK